MKTLKLFFATIAIIVSFNLIGQVAINNEGLSPDSSAMLDVKSNSTGILIPRMTTTQRDAINNPADGLMIYNISDSAFYFYNGISWKNVNEAVSDNDWTISGNDMYSTVSGNVGIGTTTPGSKFEVYNNGLAVDIRRGTNDLGGIMFHEVGTSNTQWIFPFFRGWQSDNLIVRDDDASIDVMTFQYGTGKVGIGAQSPLTKLHIKDSDISLPSAALHGEQLTLENTDAGFGLYSSNGGGYGSFISLGEIASGALTNKWSIVRTTSANAGHENQLRFTYGTDVNYALNPAVLTLDEEGNMGVGTITPDVSAALEVSSISKGFLPPRMSSTQMNAISSPPAGLMIFNTTVNSICYYDGSTWNNLNNVDGKSGGYITHGGQTYQTVIIGTQCWMRENLNIGTMIDSTLDQTDDGTIEKYCYHNSEDSCIVYGGLYQWNEMMQYVTTGGEQGICPMGWHLPTDAEWKTLEMYLGMSQAEADAGGFRGTDEGGKLKEVGTAYWDSPNFGATNSSGFTGLSGGQRHYGYFRALGTYGDWWSSTENNSLQSWHRYLGNTNAQVHRYYNLKTDGLSVRCIKN